MNFNNNGFIFLEIVISLTLISIVLTIFILANSSLVSLLEETKKDNLFYINSLNLGNELIVYLIDSSNTFPELNRNYSFYEIENQFFKLNSSIDEEIKEEIMVNIIRKHSLHGRVLYNLNIIYDDNKIIYSFFR